MKNKKILITGGAGFIGSHLVDALYKKGHDLFVLDNLSPQIHGDVPEKSPLLQSIQGKAQLVVGDVCNADDWHKVIANVNIIVHLAAETGTGQSMYQISRYNEVNCTGTSMMLDMLTNGKHNVEKVVVASSRAIYGEGKYFCDSLNSHVYPHARKPEDMERGDFAVKCPITATDVACCATDEDSQIQPNSIYGLTKYYQERAIMVSCSALGIPCVALRYQNVYGPGQSLSNPYTGILSIFSTRLLENKPINIFEDGTESRDFVYIDDVIEATVLAIDDNRADYEVFNVGTGIATDVMTVAHTLSKIYNSQSEISISGQFRKGDIRHNYADLSKISSILGFRPQVSFQDGIRHFCQWVLGQESHIDLYEKSLQEMRERGLMK
jgi:dTDP-L-rhamnose 4-epimerase